MKHGRKFPVLRLQSIKKTIQFAAVPVAALYLAACQMAPVKFSELNEGEWRAKVLIKDKKTNKSQIVNLNVRAEDERKLRMDVTSTIGTHLASFLLVKDKLEYLVINEKTRYQTVASRGALNGVLNVPIDPRVLYNVLFDRPIEDKGWSCELSEDGYLKACRDLRARLNIAWIYRKGKERTVEIDHPSAKVQMNLYSFSARIQEPETAFALKTPSSFKTVKLR